MQVLVFKRKTKQKGNNTADTKKNGLNVHEYLSMRKLCEKLVPGELVTELNFKFFQFSNLKEWL